MTTIVVGTLSFGFPTGWEAHAYDTWSFYRNQFAKMRDAIKANGGSDANGSRPNAKGVKAIDVLALDPASTAWFIEVKDYRVHPRTKPSEVSDEFAQKVFDTLAALLPAKVNANHTSEQQMAIAVLGAKRLRTVLHLEQPTKTSRLRPRAINPADVAQKLKRLLKPVDAHPFVAEMASMGSLHWTVG